MLIEMILTEGQWMGWRTEEGGREPRRSVAALVCRARGARMHGVLITSLEENSNRELLPICSASQPGKNSSTYLLPPCLCFGVGGGGKSPKTTDGCLPYSCRRLMFLLFSLEAFTSTNSSEQKNTHFFHLTLHFERSSG